MNLDRDRAVEIRRGDRVAQLVVVAFAEAEPAEVEELTATERGERGFGSTGVEHGSIGGRAGSD